MIKTTLGGLIFAWGCLITSIILEGADMKSFLKLAPAILVFGGTIGATAIGFSMEEVTSVPAKLKMAFSSKKYEYEVIIKEMVEYATISRRDGVLALEDRIDKVTDVFTRKGLQMAVDGVDQERIREAMETDLTSMQHWFKSGEEFMKQMGGFSPTLGIIGTVLGLIMMLSDLSNTEGLGHAIASAFIATMYGVSAANLLYLPLAIKLKTVAAHEMLEKRIILEGIIAIQSGVSPRMLEQLLQSNIYPEKAESKAGAKGGGAKAGKE